MTTDRDINIIGREHADRGDTVLVCPLCAEAFIHIDGVGYRPHEIEWARNDDSPVAPFIEGWCECCGHRWRLTYGAHKGIVVVRAIDLGANDIHAASTRAVTDFLIGALNELGRVHGDD